MKKIAGIVLSISLLPCLAWADLDAGSQTLGLNVGIGWSAKQWNWQDVIAGGRDEEVSDGGASLGFQYVYFLSGKPAVGLGLDITGSDFGDHTAENVFPNFNSATQFNPSTVMVIGKMQYPKGFFRPYIFGGIGVHSTKLKVDLTPNGSSTWTDGGTDTRTIIDDKSGSMAGGLGIGADWYPIDTFFLGVELRSTYLFSNTYELTDAGRAEGFHEAEGDLSVSNLLFRLGFKFGA